MLWTAIAIASAATPEGTPFPGTPFFHHSALKSTTRVDATRPQDPSPNALERHRCMVWVKIGIDGLAVEPTVVSDYPGQGCTAPYSAAAVQAVGQWRWKPVKIDKQKTTVHTQIAVVFEPVQAAPKVDVSIEGSPPPAPVPQPKRDVFGRPKDDPAETISEP